MKYTWDKKYLRWGITAFLVIICSILFFMILSRITVVAAVFGALFRILRPILYGLIIAYLLAPLLNLMERKFLKRFGAAVFPRRERRAAALSRGIGVFLSLLFLVVVVGLLLLLVIPQLYDSVVSLITNMPGYVSASITWIQGLFADNPELETTVVNLLNNLTKFLTNWAESSFLPMANDLLATISSGVLGVVVGIVNIFIGVVVSVYLLFSKETFIAQAKKGIFCLFRPRVGNEIIRNLAYTHRVFSKSITGKLLDSFIIGCLCFVCLTVFRIPYPVLISIIVGVTNIIPFFGPFLGAIPSAFLILLVDPMKCLIFIVIILVLQQIDGNILGPKILGLTTGLSSFWVLFSILLAGGLFGFVGMVCGVPVFAVFYAGIRALCNARLKQKGLPVSTAAYRDLQSIHPQTGEPAYTSVGNGGSPGSSSDPPSSAPPAASQASSAADGTPAPASEMPAPDARRSDEEPIRNEETIR